MSEQHKFTIKPNGCIEEPMLPYSLNKRIEPESSSSSDKDRLSKSNHSTGEKKRSSSSHSHHAPSSRHHSSSTRRKSRDHSSRHSSGCKSRKDGGHCDCRSSPKRSHKGDRSSGHRSHSSHSSRSRRKYRDLKLQVDLHELFHHVKLVEERKKTTKRIPPRVPWTPHETITRLKYQELFRVEKDPNGGGTVCHLYWDEISHFSESVIKEIAKEFIMLSYSEDEQENAFHVMGIVHGGADYLPDLLDYMADHYPAITVKVGSLTGRATQSLTMGEYRDEAYKSYSNGTFRFAPLQELSICGVQGEEVGAYFPDFVKRLETSPNMFPVMPWRSLSVVATDNPRESNDGPIFWVRPGEQTLPSSVSARCQGRLAKGVSRLSEAREALFEDRTKPHADQIGIDGVYTDTAPTAAVGLLKAVNCGHPEHKGRATKDVVAFHAQDYNALLDALQIDVYEPPLRQCTMWLETAKLNSLRRQGYRYARVQLHDGDVYYLPRKIIHQFQTISAVASVAWHVRFVEYFKKTGAPNLHNPTGLNKGAVYYEKAVVPPYQPPEPIVDPEEEIVHKSPRKRYRRRSEGEFKVEHKDDEPKTPVKNDKMADKTDHSGRAKPLPSPGKLESPLKFPLAHHRLTPKSPHKSPHKSTPVKSPVKNSNHVLQPLSSSEPRHAVETATVDRSSAVGVVAPIRLEKSASGNSFSVVQMAPPPQRPRGPASVISVEKPLKENIQFKKRKAEKDDKVCDVLGEIMSQMKKAKKE